ncbi:MAG: T9SS type A sorting domain-containing protein [Ignavibacteriales bacterium]|nr:T9SS type A sorting domain-containing protein [Ignavibacteriales bacterium]
MSYSIPEDGFVTLNIYDVLGKQVAVLENDFKPAGNYKYSFDATNFSSGLYFYTIKSGKFLQTKKMLLMK